MPALVDMLGSASLNDYGDGVDNVDVDYPDEFRCSDCSPALVHSGNVPAEIIIKDSYCLVDQPYEAIVYKAARGNFGLPTVHHGYSVHLLLDGHPIPNRTSRIRPKDAKLIRFGLPGQENVTEPEKREHRRLILETVGKDVFHTTGPRQLIKCVLHTIMGTFSLADKTLSF